MLNTFCIANVGVTPKKNETKAFESLFERVFLGGWGGEGVIYYAAFQGENLKTN